MLKIIKKKNNRETNKQDIPIFPTAPVYNTNMSVNNYADLLNDAINDKNVYNLVVMGSYGVGKSTIIKNYSERYNKKKIINISIGSFLKQEIGNNKNDKNIEKYIVITEELMTNNIKQKHDNNNDVCNVITNNKNDDKRENGDTNFYNDCVISQKDIDIVDSIEKSILKQIINLRYSEELPKSNFKHLNRKTDNYIHNFSMFFIVIIIEMYLFFEDLNILEEIRLDFLSSNTFWFIKWLILFLILFPFAYELCLLFYNAFSRAIINKIKLKSYELDIKNEDNRELTFTKQITEIMYFFSIAKYDVVIFEDIDRFPNDITMKVLEELKELNFIINHSKAIKRKITFVYTVKDGVFKNPEQKSKFFDYTISVMPIISKYNSLIILKQKFEESNIQNIDESVLSIISKYIFDIRTIINIINDYMNFSIKLYGDYKNLNSTISAKVLAIVAYKNYDVGNYEKMLSDNNFVDKAINEFETEKRNKISERESNINEIKENIDEKYTEIKDIKKAMIDYVENNYGTVSSLEISNQYINVASFMKNEFVVDDSIISFNCDDRSINEDLVFSSIGYKKQDLIDLYNDTDNLMKNIEEEEKFIDKILQYKDTDYKFLEHNQFLKDLILANFISQDYVDYITLPVEGSTLTSTESKFIFGVSHNNYYPNIKFKNYKNIIKYLKPASFLSTNILNYDLVSYLINNRQSYGEYYNNLINQFKILKSEHIEFLYSFSFVNETDFNELLELLVDKNIDLYTPIAKSKYNSIKDYKEKLVCSLLKCDSFAKSVTDSESLKQYIVNDLVDNGAFNSILNENDNVLANLIYLDVKFIDISKLNKNNMELVYENHLYKFTSKNLKTLFGDCKSIKEMYIDNKSNIEFFKEYVYKSFSSFYSEYYFNNTFKIKDEQLIKKIITNLNLTYDQLKEIYTREDFIINVDDIKLDLYDDAVKYKHVKANWNNIKYLYNIKKSDKKLLMNFINENKKILFTEKNVNSLKNIPEDFKKEILNGLLKTYDIDSIMIVISSFDLDYPKYNLDDDFAFKWKEIIKLNLVKFDVKNFQKIELLNDIKCKKTYLKNWYESIQNIKTANIPDIIILELLNCKFISQSDKFNLLCKISNNISIEDFITTFRIVFPEKCNYEVCVSNRQKNKILPVIKSLIYNVEVKKVDKYNSMIKFCIKPDIKKVQIDRIKLNNK